MRALRALSRADFSAALAHFLFTSLANRRNGNGPLIVLHRFHMKRFAVPVAVLPYRASQAAPLYFCKQSIPDRSNSQEDSLLLHCHICSKNPIPAPTDSTVHTRFTCKFCAARVWRHRQQVRIRRNVEEHAPEPTVDELQAESVLNSQLNNAHEECAISGD